MASDGPTLARQEDHALQRTPEMRETVSGNVELRKDPEHTSKVANPAEREHEVRERAPRAPGNHGEATALQRTPEMHETVSGNVELRQDPEHTSKVANPAVSSSAEQILDPRGARTAATPHDILAVRRSVDDTDTRLE